MTARVPPPNHHEPLAGTGVSSKQRLAYKMKRQHLKLRYCRRIKMDVFLCVCVTVTAHLLEAWERVSNH